MTCKEIVMSSRAMRRAAGLGGLLAVAGFGFGIVQGAFAQSEQPAKMPEEGIAQAAPTPAIPMERVLAQLKAEGYGEVYEIEREHGRYEVKAKNREGRMVELALDASTGKTLETEQEDDD
jgi:hypothetical protein